MTKRRDSKEGKRKPNATRGVDAAPTAARAREQGKATPGRGRGSVTPQAKEAKLLDRRTARALPFVNSIPDDAKGSLFLMSADEVVYVNLGRLDHIQDAIKYGGNLMDGTVRGQLLCLIDYVEYHASQKSMSYHGAGRPGDDLLRRHMDLILALNEKNKIQLKRARMEVAEWSGRSLDTLARELRDYKKRLDGFRFRTSSTWVSEILERIKLSQDSFVQVSDILKRVKVRKSGKN